MDGYSTFVLELIYNVLVRGLHEHLCEEQVLDPR